MRNRPSENLKLRTWRFAIWSCLLGWVLFVANATVPSAFAQAQQTEEKKEVTEEIPKAPKDDFTVEVYKALDELKKDKLTFKDRYRVDKADEDVEIVITYYNWGVTSEDFWNRQINIETKTKEGFVVEKILKCGFGDLGYVKAGDKKTLDNFKKEKITVSGETATASMVELQIGKSENQRYHNLMEKFILKK